MHIKRNTIPWEIIIFSVYIFTWLITSSNQPLWTDEIFSAWSSGTGNISIQKSLEITENGRDAMFPFFYVISNIWNYVTPPVATWMKWQDNTMQTHELWLRLPGLFFIIAGIGTLTHYLQKKYGRMSTAVGLTLFLFCTRPAEVEMHWFRGYALLIGLCALHLSLIGTKSSKLFGWKWASLNGTLQAAITMTHPFGILYAAAANSPIFLNTCLNKKWKQATILFLTSLPAGLLFLIEIPKMNKVQALTEPWGLWNTPDLLSLVSSMLQIGPIYNGSLLILAAIVILLTQQSKPKSETNNQFVETGVLFYLAVPILIWVVAQVNPIFSPRYFLPGALSILISGTILWDKICITKISRIITGIALCLICLFQIQEKLPSKSTFTSTMELRGELDPNMFQASLSDLGQNPIIVEHIDDFLPRLYYSPNLNYVFILDESKTKDPKTPNIKEITLVTRLVQAHEKSAVETNNKVGIPPARIITPDKWENLLIKNSHIYIIKSNIDTASDLETTMKKQGWIKQTKKNNRYVLWEKPKS